MSSRVIGAEAKAALGFQLHVTDVFLEELAKVGGEELPYEVVKAFLRPFVDQLKGGREERLRDQASACVRVEASLESMNKTGTRLKIVPPLVTKKSLLTEEMCSYVNTISKGYFRRAREEILIYFKTTFNEFKPFRLRSGYSGT